MFLFSKLYSHPPSLNQLQILLRSLSKTETFEFTLFSSFCIQYKQKFHLISAFFQAQFHLHSNGCDMDSALHYDEMLKTNFKIKIMMVTLVVMTEEYSHVPSTANLSSSSESPNEEHVADIHKINNYINTFSRKVTICQK